MSSSLINTLSQQAERREQAALGGVEEEESPEVEELTDVKDLRSNKKKENKEKQIRKKSVEVRDIYTITKYCEVYQ